MFDKQIIDFIKGVSEFFYVSFPTAVGIVGLLAMYVVTLLKTGGK